MTNSIRDIIKKYGMDTDYEHSELYTGQDTVEWSKVIDRCTNEAETAINAYILGEVEKLIGDDEVYEGHTINWEIEHHNQLRQELRNKANKKFGGK